MIVSFRPCARKPRWRKKRMPTIAVQIICCCFGLAIAVGLLFICPRWLLVIFVVILSAALILLLRC